MQIGEKFYLNWQTQQLKGFENNKSRECIESIMLGIEMGDEIPPIRVFQVDENLFSISGYYYVETLENKLKIDAGHHRSIAHYLKNAPLPCILVEKKLAVPGMPGQIEHQGNILIQDIKIISSMGEYIRKKQLFPNYR